MSVTQEELERDPVRRALGRAMAAAVSASYLDTSERRALDAFLDVYDQGARLVRPEDLMSTRDVAELLEIDRTTASRWKTSGYLPEPFSEPATGPIWLRPVVEEFAAAHRRSADAAGRRRSAA